MARKSRKPDSRMTVKGIAEQAGVSIGAVSSVLTNRHIERRISPATVEKIRAVARKFGYVPDINARRLRSGTRRRNNVILAFVTSYEAPLTLVNALIAELRQAAIERESTKIGLNFSVMVEMFAAGQLKDMPGLLTGDHFNAAIITNTTAEDDQFLQRAHLPFPVVLVNRSIPRYSCVVEDPDAGAKAAKLLLAGKRRQLAVLHGSPLTQSTRGRVDGFIQSVTARHGAPPAEIIAERLSEAAAADAVLDYLRQGGRLEGLYAVTDGMALGAYHALKKQGLKIPKDVAVVGVGDYDTSPFFDPPLTVVGVQGSQLGGEASRLLLRQLEGGELSPLKVEIPVLECIRESTRR